MSWLPWIILSALLLVSFVAGAVSDNATQQTIGKICNQTEDHKFCNSIFTDNMNTSSPSIKDLTNITVGQGEHFSSNTVFFISQLLRNAGDERDGLQTCADAYAKVDAAFDSALSSFSQGQYSEIHKILEDVSDAVGICKTGFAFPSYDVNPMMEKNRKMKILITMAMTVSNMLIS